MNFRAEATYLLYGSSWHYEHESPAKGQRNMLVITAQGEGSVTGVQEYAAPNPQAHRVTNYVPTDAVTDTEEVILAGHCEDRTAAEGSSSGHSRPFTLHV